MDLGKFQGQLDPFAFVERTTDASRRIAREGFLRVFDCSEVTLARVERVAKNIGNICAFSTIEKGQQIPEQTDIMEFQMEHYTAPLDRYFNSREEDFNVHFVVSDAEYHSKQHELFTKIWRFPENSGNTVTNEYKYLMEVAEVSPDTGKTSWVLKEGIRREEKTIVTSPRYPKKPLERQAIFLNDALHSINYSSTITVRPPRKASKLRFGR